MSFVIPGTVYAFNVDSFFDISYRIEFEDKGESSPLRVIVTDTATREKIDVTVREVHRLGRTFGNDPDDLCTYRILVDLGGKQYYMIKAQRSMLTQEVKIQDVAHHRGHVTVLK